MTGIPTYTVTLRTPGGVGAIDVPSFMGADAAARRARISAAAIGWGDIDKVLVLSTAYIGLVDRVAEKAGA